MATIKQRIDNVTENVTDGKQDIALAITDKGVSTSSSVTFSTMADNIRAIETPPRDRIVNSANTIYVIAGESGVTIGYSGNTASGRYSTAEGDNTEASDDACHAEGYQTKATGMYSHSEGYQSKAIGNYSHAEGGYQTTASGMCSHVEGYGTEANGEASHAEGISCVAEGKSSHAEGNSSNAVGEMSHAEGGTTNAHGWCSHTSGNYTMAFNNCEFACGRHNKSTSGDNYNSNATLFSVGFGTPPSESNRKNAIEITQTGVLKCNVAWQVGSDRKLKENIIPLGDNTLEKVLQLNPVRFTLKDDKEKKDRIGFIAQEVEELYPEYVTVSVDNEGEETRYLDYSQMVSILCKAIQELTKKVEMLENK